MFKQRSSRRLLILAGILLVTLLMALPALAETTVILGELNGISNPSDEYQILVEAGGTVTVTLECTPDSTLDPALMVTGPEGVSGEDDDSDERDCDQGAGSYLIFDSPNGGVYTIIVSSYEIVYDDDPEDENANGFYQLTINGDFVFLGGSNAFADSRINNFRDKDIGAPVAIYLDPFEVFAVDTSNGKGIQVVSLSDEEIEAAGVPTDANLVLAEAVNPSTGKPIVVYRLTTGEFQLNTAYADGKAYIVLWDEDGVLVHLES